MTPNPNDNNPLAAGDALPLYNLFKAVKRLDEQTGHATVDLQSYLTLLQTLQQGYMLLSRESVFLLCEKLWLKPYHLKSPILNRQVLQQLVYQTLAAVALPATGADTPIKKTVAPKRSAKGRKTTPDPSLLSQSVPPAPSEAEQELTRQRGSLSVYVDDAAAGETASQAAADESDRFLPKSFFVKGVYLPVNPRRIEQSVRLYRQRLKDQRAWETDWPGTVRTIAQQGHFSDVARQEKDVYSSNFTVLIDHSASMAAFDAYSEEIALAVARGSIHDYEEIYYFNNYPGAQLYTDRLQSAALPFDALAGGHKKSILIISDAGAARGTYNEERIRFTLRSLRRLQKHRIAWMNPIPRARWKNSSAAMIAEYVNMFDIGEGSIDGLNNIVRLFKSKIQTGKT